MRVLTLAVLLALSTACNGPQNAPPGPTRSPNAPWFFAVKGDWGAGTDAQAAVTSSMCAAREDTPFEIVVTTGDNFYNPDGEATPRNYDGPESCLISHPGHEWRAAWGNHDLFGDSTARILGATERYYTFTDRGISFFMLDSNRASDADQTAWLEQALSDDRAEMRIAVFHHPPFTSGSVHEPSTAVRESWVPLFVRYGVSLVLSGHQHLYERFRVDGVDYVVTGGGGALLYGCTGNPPERAVCSATYHFLLVNVLDSAVDVSVIDSTGGEIDRFQTQAVLEVGL